MLFFLCLSLPAAMYSIFVLLEIMSFGQFKSVILGKRFIAHTYFSLLSLQVANK